MMSEFTIHTIETAPEASQPLLQSSLDAFRMIPNLHGVMAEAPGLLEGYQTLHALAQQTSFTKEELTVVWQAINVEHACHYCVPAHTAIAKTMGVSDDVIAALRDETPLPNERLEALRSTTLEIARRRGVVGDSDLESFFGHGFTKRQLLEVVMILAQKVMSNYVNHLAHTPVDAPFQKFAWEKANATTAE